MLSSLLQAYIPTRQLRSTSRNFALPIPRVSITLAPPVLDMLTHLFGVLSILILDPSTVTLPSNLISSLALLAPLPIRNLYVDLSV